MTTKNMVILFDESSEPVISDDYRTDWFIGVGVAYEKSDEEIIFSKCKADFGLMNSKPLKNDRISNNRVLKIIKVLEDLPVSIYVSGVNTANSILRKVIVDYECFGEKNRLKFRKVRKRPIPQIIHSQVLDHCLCNLIVSYFEDGGSDAAFDVFIDNWSIPENDIYISLEHRATSMFNKISSLCSAFAQGRLISIAPLELLSKDSRRKRFVDVVSSTFNRAYLKPNYKKYSIEIVETLKKYKRAQCGDATQHSINIMQAVMKGTPGKG